MTFRRSDSAERSLAARLRRSGLAVPSRIALEALRPLRPLLAAAVALGSALPLPRTMVEAVGSDAAWDRLASAIDDGRDGCPTSEG